MDSVRSQNSLKYLYWEVTHIALNGMRNQGYLFMPRYSRGDINPVLEWEITYYFKDIHYSYCYLTTKFF